jgi:RNA polymerase sigma-70 factor, ECF subfamily
MYDLLPLTSLQPPTGPVVLAGLGDTARAEDPDGVLTRAYLEHREPLRRWLVARTRDEDLAEELLHEAYLRLMRELRRGVDIENPRAWLFHAASNLMISNARHAQVVGRHVPQDPGYDAASAESVVLAQERMEHLHRALACLSESDRDLLLAAGIGNDGPELAVKVGISNVALRARLCRARKRLRDQVVADQASCLTSFVGLPA